MKARVHWSEHGGLPSSEIAHFHKVGNMAELLAMLNDQRFVYITFGRDVMPTLLSTSCISSIEDENADPLRPGISELTTEEMGLG